MMIKVGVTAKEVIPDSDTVKRVDMSVELDSYTPNPLDVIYKAGKISIGRKLSDSFIDSLSKEEKIRFVKRLIKIGHLSVLEHVKFSFIIRDISRITSHQLVRHRIASYTQESQRYHKQKSSFYLPDVLYSDKSMPESIIDFLQTAYDLYTGLLKKGINKEDARYILPQSFTTTIYVTMNLRELILFVNLRTHKSAQTEISIMASKMKELVINVLGFDPFEVK